MILIEFLVCVVLVIAVGYFTYIKTSKWVNKKFPDPVAKLEEAKKDLNDLQSIRDRKIKDIRSVDDIQEDFFKQIHKQVQKRPKRSQE